MRVKSNGIIYKLEVFMHYLHIHPGIITVCMLVLSNVFMTFAWYAHLKNLSSLPWFGAALASWGDSFF